MYYFLAYGLKYIICLLTTVTLISYIESSSLFFFVLNSKKLEPILFFDQCGIGIQYYYVCRYRTLYIIIHLGPTADTVVTNRNVVCVRMSKNIMRQVL